MSRTARGFRNNNPGNLIKTPTKWQGKTAGSDPRFETFVSLPYGIRALLVDLHSKISNGYNTVRKIISRFAPPNENETGRYIEYVSAKTGFSPDQKLNASKDTISNLARFIIIKENGSGITEAELAAGWDLFPKKKALAGPDQDLS